MAIAHIIRFLIYAKTKKWRTFFRNFFFGFPKNIRHFVIFAYIKSLMICAIAINILNLKPFDFFVSDDPLINTPAKYIKKIIYLFLSLVIHENGSQTWRTWHHFRDLIKIADLPT